MDAFPDELMDLQALKEAMKVPLPLLFDYSASFLWALSGALIAARRGFVGVGIGIIAVVSATGGGLLRDGLLLPVGVPAVLRNPVYILLALSAATLVMVAGRYIDRWRFIGPTLHMVDALGAGTYAAVGASKALAADLPLAAMVIVGVINAVGGGLLRDVLMRRVPDLFKPGLPLGLASMVGAILFSLLVIEGDFAQTDAAILTVGTVFVLTLTMLRLHIRSRPLEAFRGYWEDRN